MIIAALIVAAGRGSRAGTPLPKQWQPLGAARVADVTLARFANHPSIGPICMVLHPDDIDRAPAHPGLILAEGGATRAASVQNGLAALAAQAPDLVLIHDVARPCVSLAVIDGVIAALDHGPAAAPALAVTDALWRGSDARVTGTEDRSGLFRAQTPQGFHFAAIRDAHAMAQTDAEAQGPTDAADDVAIARAAGLDVVITQGDEANIKITWPEDFLRAERILGTEMKIRLGNGYDVHRFGPGDAVVLCGVTLPHDRGLQGHSDADVGMHALTDAIYGALAEGDIGRHFPPSDPQWKGADSRIFLRHAVALAGEKGYKVNNLDVTLVCEHPKIGPHADAMRAALSELCQTTLDAVSVKATTSERLGFTGRGEGIAALATVTLTGI
ncbi:bifunctional 2-C-methyl-D-erythritol 4-phosphate cytidylyltransferase/2-C-methyl-D-erythritol 2,4-cyclodiphosphate synthase [Roseovarius sp. C7]|uniref:bifunctional 2-C-methyl-D-erythritol 4-phosphate cytidylyltransferase/2-C-methyl-D-erythritol 2,4-cyclodiphosphate synthase n=1 Tax=Roseovarius sp. C7 TaxID=3398643 RepID=UPI0039F615AA